MNLILSKYLHGFGNLKRGSAKYGAAPHKPVFLLTLIDLFNKGLVPQNKFDVNADLVGTFKENWDILVESSPIRFHSAILLPAKR